LHPDRRLTGVLLFFHFLRPSKLLGFALVSATVIGWFKPLLRLLMLRTVRPRGLILIPWYLMQWSLMLSRRSSAVMSLSGHFLLDFGFFYFQERALKVNMPTEAAVMAYRRSSKGMRHLSAWNITIDLVLPFILNSGRRL
jgi:hypothetical protein